MRLVSHAAYAVKGSSLNSKLLCGLDRILGIDEVLVNLRIRAVILTAHVKEMFHSVLVREQDRVRQQFFWRDGDTSKEPNRYIMNVLILDASSLPNTAIYVMNKNAERFRKAFPRAVIAVQCETYMDDVLTGGRSEDKVINLRRDILFICEEGGLTIAKWQSNSKQVLKSIPSELRAEGSRAVLEGGTWVT